MDCRSDNMLNKRSRSGGGSADKKRAKRRFRHEELSVNSVTAEVDVVDRELIGWTIRLSIRVTGMQFAHNEFCKTRNVCGEGGGKTETKGYYRMQLICLRRLQSSLCLFFPTFNKVGLYIG